MSEQESKYIRQCEDCGAEMIDISYEPFKGGEKCGACRAARKEPEMSEQTDVLSREQWKNCKDYIRNAENSGDNRADILEAMHKHDEAQRQRIADLEAVVDRLTP